MIKSLATLFAVTSLTGCIVIAAPMKANVHAQKTLTLNASQFKSFNVDVGAGSLEIIGQSNRSEIEVIADIYTSKEAPQGYELSLDDKGNSAELFSEMTNTVGSWQGSSPRIDLVVYVPKDLALDIKDGSGSMSISDIKNNVTINDGSGSLSVEDVEGDLKIVDNSGSINVNKVSGNLSIDDGSGSIYVKNVAGDADIEDGSGSMTVTDVKGFVTVDDGSGSISVNNTGGLKIIEAGSGGLNVDNIKGQTIIDS